MLNRQQLQQAEVVVGAGGVRFRRRVHRRHRVPPAPSRDRRQVLSSLAQLGGVIAVLAACCSYSWIVATDKVEDGRVFDLHVGLLRSYYTYTAPTASEVNVRNEREYLVAGESVLIFIVAGFMAGIISSGLTFAMYTGHLIRTKRVVHSLTVWCAFATGLSFIVGAIMYTVTGPTIQAPMKYGWCFIVTLTTGFFVLINGLVLVLSRHPDR